LLLGRTHNSKYDLYKHRLRIQNLWLAACARRHRAGVVSVFHDAGLLPQPLLGNPDRIEIVGYLCLGHSTKYFKRRA